MKHLAKWTLGLVLAVNGAVAAPNAPEKLSAQQKKFSETLASQMKKHISLVLAQRFKFQPEDFNVDFQLVKVEPALDYDPRVVVQILGGASVNFQKMEGLFSHPVLLQKGAHTQEHQVTAVVKIVGPALVTAKNLKRGDTLLKSDLQMVKMPWRLLPQNSLVWHAEAVEGLGVKTFIPAGSPLHLDLVDQPLDIKSGDWVEVTVKSGPGVMIRSRGIAKQEGRKGDLIRLVQPDTKKTIQGQIVGPKSVEVVL